MLLKAIIVIGIRTGTKNFQCPIKNLLVLYFLQKSPLKKNKKERYLIIRMSFPNKYF